MKYAAGPLLSFGPWCARVVDDVRRRLPEARATRRGAHVVTIRFGDRAAVIEEAGTSWWVRFEGGAMASLCVVAENGDAFVAGNVGKAISGFFDARHSLAERR